jgi:hypothetical protein
MKNKYLALDKIIMDFVGKGFCRGNALEQTSKKNYNDLSRLLY